MRKIFQILNADWRLANRIKKPTVEWLQNFIISRNLKSINPHAVIRPHAATFEITSICNSRCSFCPHGFGTFTRKKETMNNDLFFKIIRICEKEAINAIMFSGLGEPLCDKEFIIKAQFVVENGLTLDCLTTNGMLLNEETAAALCDLNLKRLNISIDSLIPAEYERIRKGLSFDRVISNIINFLDMNQRTGENVHVTLNAVIEGSNYSKKAEYKKTFGKYFGRQFRMTFYPAHNWAGNLPISHDSSDTNENEQLKTYCRRIFDTHVQIRVDGSLSLCCVDYNNQCSLGIIERSILEVWNSRKIIKIRKMHVEGKWDNLRICRACSEKVIGRSLIKEVK